MDALCVGERLTQGVYDRSNALLLAADTIVTPRILRLLKRHHLKSVAQTRVTTPDREERNIEDSASPLDDLLSEELCTATGTRCVTARERPRLSFKNLKGEAARGLEMHTEASGKVAQVCTELLAGQTIKIAEVRDIVSGFVELAALDFDLLPLIVSLQRSQDDYFFDHSVNVALLSISIAAQLGLRGEELSEIALCALLQDVGMLKVPADIRCANRPLTDDEIFEVKRHPYHTVDLLENLKGVPLAAKFVGYQVHERCDGSGYPRKRSGMHLHKYAKIVAIADSYCAMTRPRPHRTALCPYEAIKIMLVEANAEKYDRNLVRAFLDTISVFPIGSVVELSSGAKARVIRANPGLHTQPMIVEIGSDSQSTGRLIDLSASDELKIVLAH